MMNFQDITSINPQTTTVGEIVAENYHAAGTLRKFGLDFCCGGGKTLAEACKKKNIVPADVIQELQNNLGSDRPSDENYQAWQPDYLIDHIENTHHSFVRSKSDEIAGYAAKVARVHGEQHPENVEIYHLFMELAAELGVHLEEEEKKVFPLIREIYESRTSGTEVQDQKIQKLKSYLNRMNDDHENAGYLIESIRRLSRDFTPPVDACTTYRILYLNLEGFEDDLHKHVHLENNILFKKAERLAGDGQ